MKEFNIKITDDDKVFINDEERKYTYNMDTDPEIDLDKKILLSLANVMGYEAMSLFEEITDKLNEILFELNKEDLI